MNILGLNLNPEGYDPSAALVIGGSLVAAGEEERWTGAKHEPAGVPENAARWCLDFHRLKPGDLDVIAYGWNYARFINGSPLSDKTDPLLTSWLGQLAGVRRATHFYCDHHRAHAYGAWAASEYAQDAAIIVADGSGERESTSAWAPDGSGGIKRLWDRPLGNSLGFFYEAACLSLGWHTLDGGKTMGLASYGEPCYDLPSILTAPANTELVSCATTKEVVDVDS